MASYSSVAFFNISIFGSIMRDQKERSWEYWQNVAEGISNIIREQKEEFQNSLDGKCLGSNWLEKDHAIAFLPKMECGDFPAKYHLSAKIKPFMSKKADFQNFSKVYIASHLPINGSSEKLDAEFIKDFLAFQQEKSNKLTHMLYLAYFSALNNKLKEDGEIIPQKEDLLHKNYEFNLLLVGTGNNKIHEGFRGIGLRKLTDLDEKEPLLTEYLCDTLYWLFGKKYNSVEDILKIDTRPAYCQVMSVHGDGMYMRHKFVDHIITKQNWFGVVDGNLPQEIINFLIMGNIEMI